MALDWNSVKAGVDAVSDSAGSISEFASAATDAASDPNFWDTGVEFGTKAFDWLDDTSGWIEDNANTAKLLAGVIGGAGSYFNAKEQRDFEEKMFEREQQARQIVPGRNGASLGVTPNSISKGLITNGLIANRDDPKRTQRRY